MPRLRTRTGARLSDERVRATIREWETTRSGEAASAWLTHWLRGATSTPTVAAFTAAWLVEGGRDPRHDPRPGDEVCAKTRRQKPRVWTVGRPSPSMPQPMRDAFDPTAPPNFRLVRRHRIGAEQQRITETVLLQSWRRAFKDGIICKVACESCEGIGHTSTSITEDGGVAIFQFKCGNPHECQGCCDECRGTGHAVHGASAKAKAPTPVRSSHV